MPDGADAVVMVEETETGADDEIRVFIPVYPRQHVGRQGADISSGQVVLEPGTVLTPSRVGAVAALGLSEVKVFDRPTVAILSTGNEIVEPGEPLGPGQIYDINRFTLGAVIEEHGGVSVRYPTAADTLDALEAAVDTAVNHDVLVFSGGSSVGERDLTLDILERKGRCCSTVSPSNLANRRHSVELATHRSWGCLDIPHPVCRMPTCCSSHC